MPGPYRETDNAPPAPLAELAWRRRVARSARWATLLALAGIPVLAVTHWLLAHFMLAGVVVWCMVGAALHSRQRAMGWLSNQGYLPAERALAERLVDRVPADTVPLLKPRKPPQPRKNKQRVRDDEPRVRVAAEAEAIDREADAMDEPALDDAEPPRAVTVHDPRDPRA